MNAYELADELIAKKNIFDKPKNIDAANMLRQQADRIAELEKQSEPVAWMAEHFDGRKRVEITGNVYDQDVGWGHKRIPLYTTPQTKPAPEGLIDPKSYYIGYEDGKKAPQTKPLSDGEIDLMLMRHLWIEIMGVREFVRAIEERHGIK